MFRRAIKNYANFIWFLWMVDAVVRGIPDIAPFSLVHVWYLLCIAISNDIFHKVHIVLSIFLSLWSLKSSFQVIKWAESCLSIIRQFDALGFQWQRKLVMAVFALMNSLLDYFQKSSILFRQTMPSAVFRDLRNLVRTSD